MSFLYPLLLLLWIIPIYYIYRYKKQNISSYAKLKLPSAGKLTQKPSFKVYLLEHLYVLRAVAMILFVVALARPQVLNSEQNIHAEGIDIVLSLDISNSMYSPDLQPNRLEAAKGTALQFIRKRPNDQIGLVLFAGESFTLCPLTADHSMLMELLAGVGGNRIMKDGTAIGMGLATAVNRLKDSQAKSKVIILLTDGVNNSGTIDPVTATDLTVKNQIVVYTIGVGRQGQEFDEKLLQNIAQQTNGKYFYAATTRDLSAIYDKIDQMEKSKIEVENFSRATELFRPFLLMALLLLLAEFLIRYRFVRTIS